MIVKWDIDVIVDKGPYEVEIDDEELERDSLSEDDKENLIHDIVYEEFINTISWHIIKED